jgi:hypothetical protein
MKTKPAGSKTNAVSDKSIFWPLVSIKAVNRAKGGEPRLTYYCEYLGFSHAEFYQMETEVSGTEFQKAILKKLEFLPQQQPFSLMPPEDEERRQEKEGRLYSSLDLLLGGGVFSKDHALAVARNLTLIAHARGDMKPGCSNDIDPYLMNARTGFVSMEVLKWILEKHTPFRLLKNPKDVYKQGCGRYMVCSLSKEYQIKKARKGNRKRKKTDNPNGQKKRKNNSA